MRTELPTRPRPRKSKIAKIRRRRVAGSALPAAAVDLLADLLAETEGASDRVPGPDPVIGGVRDGRPDVRAPVRDLGSADTDLPDHRGVEGLHRAAEVELLPPGESERREAGFGTRLRPVLMA